MIVLAGPKHCGKTTVGRALAALWGGVFTDLDGEIEQRSGKTPRALYKEGADVFHAAETAALAYILEAAQPVSEGTPPVTLAAGGGLIDNKEAMALLAASGALLVFLELSAAAAWERICEDARGWGLPPFLQTEDPCATHRLLHERRNAAYKKAARFTVDAEGKSPVEIARRVAAALPDFAVPASGICRD